MATGYPYTPLDGKRKAVRLLEFSQKFDIVDPSPLSCSMKTVHLSDEGAVPAYSAISYCWGDPPFTCKSILVDKFEVKVPENTELALRYLHDQLHPIHNDVENRSLRGPLDPTHLIWIDSICINQMDKQERSEQVAYMGKVFFQAEQVLIWLGVDEGFGAAAAASMDSVIAQCRAQTDDYKKLTQTAYTWDIHGYIGAYSSEPLPAPLDYAALFAFLDLPWFKRLWVMQEVTLAKAVFCFHGINCRDFMDVAIACVWMRHRSRHIPEPIRGLYDAVSAATFFYRQRSDRGDCALRGDHDGCCRVGSCKPGNRLSTLLSWAQDRECTEPRDQVYGIMGIARPRASRLTIDYSLPLAEVYAEATRAAIKEDHSLSLLRKARTSSTNSLKWFKNNKWPSWVPVWNQSVLLERNPFRFGGQYRASSRHPLLLDDSVPTPETLRVFGLVADRVKETSAVLGYQPGAWSASHVEEIVGKLWGQFRDPMKTEVLPDGQSLEEAYCLTLVAGLRYPSQRITDECIAEFYASSLVPQALETADGKRKGDASTKRTNSQIDPEAESLERPSKRVHRIRGSVSNSGPQDRLPQSATAYDDSSNLDFLDPCERACENRCFFITEQGRMGLGPWDTQVGDEICILYGGQWPFLLRRLDQQNEEVHHGFLGQSYVHGIMQAC